MYTTHGDMIIFRPNHLDRVAGRADRYREGWTDRPREAWSGDSRERRPDYPRERRDARPAPSDAMRERMAELEARVSRLEAQLERVGSRQTERPPRREAVPDLADERRRPRERLYDPEPDGYPAPKRGRRPDREPDAGAERGPSRRAGRGAPEPAENPQVRVSLHADGGAQVSLGEVRMISQD